MHFVMHWVTEDDTLEDSLGHAYCKLSGHALKLTGVMHWKSLGRDQNSLKPRWVMQWNSVGHGIGLTGTSLGNHLGMHCNSLGHTLTLPGSWN